ncbi:hypothetical protein GCM10010495_29130 [Kitasatospora herbaricolor]|nr:hypothetical protein GCM10010495_29130 [Kitasatospora herbaricolor]
MELCEVEHLLENAYPAWEFGKFTLTRHMRGTGGAQAHHMVVRPSGRPKTDLGTVITAPRRTAPYVPLRPPAPAARSDRLF